MATEQPRTPSPEERQEDYSQEGGYPFPRGKLTPEHEQEITKLRGALRKWLLATSDWQGKVSGSREQFKVATTELSSLEIAEPFRFTPPPPFTFRPILLSTTRCYWMGLMGVFDEGEREEVENRLALIPPMRLGKKPELCLQRERCVDNPGSLIAEEYEGLMRCAMFTVIGMASNEVTKMWRELGEVGVQTWEEVF